MSARLYLAKFRTGREGNFSALLKVAFLLTTSDESKESATQVGRRRTYQRRMFLCGGLMRSTNQRLLSLTGGISGDCEFPKRGRCGQAV
jgi:hypothetical protein